MISSNVIDILTSVDPDDPLQPLFKLKTLKMMFSQ